MTNKEAARLNLTVAVVGFAAFAAGAVAGIYIATANADSEADRIRSMAQVRAENCDTIVRMGVARWQGQLGLPLTKQVTCDPLHEIAKAH